MAVEIARDIGTVRRDLEAFTAGVADERLDQFRGDVSTACGLRDKSMLGMANAVAHRPAQFGGSVHIGELRNIITMSDPVVTDYFDFC